MWNKTDFARKRVLITAGASGLGLEMARSFHSAGAQLTVCDVDRAALERLGTEMPTVHSMYADVSSESDVEALLTYAEQKMRGVDVLVNNAGVAGPTRRFEDVSLPEWEQTFAVNMTGQFLCARAAVRLLRKRAGASIINLSSAAGHLGMPGRVAYSASKWAVIGFTKTLAIELGHEGIRVNAVLPGAVDGPRIRAVIQAKALERNVPIEDVAKAYSGQAALGRMVSAMDVANMVMFLASDAAASITGQEMAVDGHTQQLS